MLSYFSRSRTEPLSGPFVMGSSNHRAGGTSMLRFQAVAYSLTQKALIKLKVLSAMVKRSFIVMFKPVAAFKNFGYQSSEKPNSTQGRRQVVKHSKTPPLNLCNSIILSTLERIAEQLYSMQKHIIGQILTGEHGAGE